MKYLIFLLLIASTVLGEGYGPFGNVYIWDSKPYVIISDNEVITKLYKQLALSANSLEKEGLSINLAKDQIVHKKHVALSYRSIRGGVDLLPILSTREGFDNVFGIWPGKEIACETLSNNDDNPRVYMKVRKIFLYHEDQLDRIVVECDPIQARQMDQIKSSRSQSLACLGYHRKGYSKFYKPYENTIPEIVSNSFAALESKYLPVNDKNSNFSESHHSDIMAMSFQGLSYKDETLYFGVFSTGDKSVKGYLVILNPAGELLTIREGFTQLLGIFDINRNWRSEVLLFYGSGYGGGIELIEPDLVDGEFKIKSLHRLDTVWD